MAPPPDHVWRSSEWCDADLAAAARVLPERDVLAALQLGAGLGHLARGLGSDTGAYLRALATLGAVDLVAARAVEPHLDAQAILHQAGDPDLSAVEATSGSTWGVYAAGGPAARLEVGAGEGGPTLSGVKPWCSLADTATHALVTASGGLYAVRLGDRSLSRDSGWNPLGLQEIRTSELTFDRTPAARVGEPGWYLDRPGFAWGGIGVAAVWFGGAAALAGRLLQAAEKRSPDQVALMHLGRVDVLLHQCLVVLQAAADDVDAGRADGVAGRLLAGRVRAVVADAAEQVMTVVGHALGPAPLTHDTTHVRRVADLTVYLRQHHAERDLARLGEDLLSDQS